MVSGCSDTFASLANLGFSRVAPTPEREVQWQATKALPRLEAFCCGSSGDRLILPYRLLLPGMANAVTQPILAVLGGGQAYGVMQYHWLNPRMPGTEPRLLASACAHEQ